jgi:hypothetical protein
MVEPMDVTCHRAFKAGFWVAFMTGGREDLEFSDGFTIVENSHGMLR